MELTEGKKITKESRFSYIWPIDGVIRLKVYTYSNIYGLENVVYKGSQDIVEISNDCLVLFLGDNFHAGVSIFERGNSRYLSNLRIFSYIYENKYITEDENITSLKQQLFCKVSCQIWQSTSKENIQCHSVQYWICNSEIESLKKSTVMLGGLERVGFVLKSGYNIIHIVHWNILYIIWIMIILTKRLTSFQLMEKSIKLFTSKKENIIESRFNGDGISKIMIHWKVTVTSLTNFWFNITYLFQKKCISIIIEIWLRFFSNDSF